VITSEGINRKFELNNGLSGSLLHLDFWEVLVGLLLISCWVYSYVLGKIFVPAIFYVGLYIGSILIPSMKKMREVALVLGVAFVTVRIIRFIPIFGDWPVAMFTIAGACFFTLRKVTTIDFAARWNFRFSRREVASTVGIVLPSLFVLIWYYRTFPEVAKTWPMPPMPSWIVPLAICGAAAINGLGEELVYRFILQRSFIRSNSPIWAILMQALAFGFLHFRNGFPQGWTGLALATLFGAAIGVQFFITRSIALAWLTHAVTDAIMFGIIVLNR
jgi:membrane protease YdiL (CAAX protease family)